MCRTNASTMHFSCPVTAGPWQQFTCHVNIPLVETLRAPIAWSPTARTLHLKISSKGSFFFWSLISGSETLFQAFITWNVEDYGLQMRTHNQSNTQVKYKYFQQNCWSSVKCVQFIDAPDSWLGLLYEWLHRWGGGTAQEWWKARLHQRLWSVILLLTLLIQVWRPIRHSNTMIIEPAFVTFGSLARCQVLMEK